MPLFSFRLVGYLLLICAGAQTIYAAEVAITMDDFNTSESALLSPQERNKRILATLQKRNIKGALFVVGQNIQSESGKGLLREWSAGGHLIGNHTFTHPRYGSGTSFEAFSSEASRCETLLKDFPGFEKLFRFPMLAEGDTVEKRDRMRQWLSVHGYRNGHVTIDASDWYIDQRMREKLKTDPNFDLSKYRDFYLQHIWDRAQYYNGLAKQVLGREVKHTLLVHFNLLNALFLDDLIGMFESQGWRAIHAKEAFGDPVYTKAPKSMPSGQSLIWSLAKETSKYEDQLRYPGEDGDYEEAAMERLGL